MMTDAMERLVDELRRQQVHVALDGDRLEMDWPIDEIDPVLIERVREYEKALAAHLRRLRDAAAAPLAARRPPALESTATDTAPLSFAQQRLWFIDQLENGSAQYHQPVALHLRGAIDREALQRAFDAMLARHETLRTVFELAGGKAIQRVCEARALRIDEHDLSTLNPAARESGLRTLAREEGRARFDLGCDPMLRAKLLRLRGSSTAQGVAQKELAQQEHVLLVTLHHIASDGWSIGVFVREFCALYAAFAEGRPSSLAPLPTRYIDFARWQRERLSGERAQVQSAYWREQLSGAPALHDLPMDRKRPPQQSYEGDVVLSDLDPALSKAVRSLARAQRCTLFMVLQAAFAILVHRRSGRDDVVIGVPVAGRTHQELEPLIGFFVNTLALRSRLTAGASFAEFLHRARDTALAAFDHQEVPFEMLVEQLRPERSRSHGPLFQLLFSLQERHIDEIALPRLEVRQLDIAFQGVKCDLELEVSDGPGGLFMRWTFATALFDRATVERMHQQLAWLLRGIVADAHAPVARLPLLPPAEAAAIAVWNDSSVSFPSDDTLIGLFEASAAAVPKRIALELGNDRWSYAELDARSSRLARRLLCEYGVKQGDLIGHCLERSLEMTVALLAIMKAGAAYVALDPGLPPERLAHMLADSAAPVVLTQASLAERLGGPHSARVLVLDANVGAEDDGEGGFSALARTDTLAYVIYTSGSTGLPKGTLNLHRGPSNRVRALQHQFPLTPEDRVLMKTPLSFDVSVWELFWPLSVGATVVLAEPQGHKDPQYLAHTLASQGVTVVHFVPSMLQMFLRSAAGRGSALRYLMTSGEALSYELQTRCIEAFPRVALVNHYGPTETGIEVTWWRFDAPRADRVVPIGRPIANNRIHVLDGEGQTVPIGVAGELHIGGAQVGEGYLNNPTLTAERFATLAPTGAPERLYKTGDLVRWMADGEVEYIGRLDNQVKLRGMRVELGEIENKAREHPAIEEAVVAVDGDLSNQRLVCYLVAKPGKAEAPARLVAELRRFMAESLPGYMTQCRYLLLDRLPLSPNGKVDRLALPRPDSVAATDDGGTDCVPAGSRTEHALAAIWSEHLELPVERIGMTDSFFEIGGNSLLSIAVQADIKQVLAIEVAIADLFQYPTIQHLARFLDGVVERAADRAPALQQAKARILRVRARGRAPG